MNPDFREKIIHTGEKALNIINDYFDGGDIENLKLVDVASRMINQSVKMEHMNQLKDHGDKSLALRLMQFIPEESRSEYIIKTNPDLRPMLLARPAGRKTK